MRRQFVTRAIGVHEEVIRKEEAMILEQNQEKERERERKEDEAINSTI